MCKMWWRGPSAQSFEQTLIVNKYIAYNNLHINTAGACTCASRDSILCKLVKTIISSNRKVPYNSWKLHYNALQKNKKQRIQRIDFEFAIKIWRKSFHSGPYETLAYDRPQLERSHLGSNVKLSDKAAINSFAVECARNRAVPWWSTYQKQINIWFCLEKNKCWVNMSIII